MSPPAHAGDRSQQRLSRRRTSPRFLITLHLRRHLGHLPLPAGPQPTQVQRPTFPLCFDRLRRLEQVTDHVQQVHDRHEVREVAAMDRPVIRLAVRHERTPPRRVEVLALRFRRHQWPERPARNHAGHARPHQTPGRPRLGLGVQDRRRRRRGLLRFRLSRWGVRRAERIARLASHLLYQTLNTPRLYERRRRFRLRILSVCLVRQRHQAGDLVLLVFRLRDAATAIGGPRPQTPAIHLDGDHLRGRRHPRRQLPTPTLLGLLVACLRQVRADFLRQLLHVAGRDR